MRGWIARAALTLLLIGVGAAPADAVPKVGDLAPDAQLTLIDGSHVRLSALRGQVVVLNFWATWCVPCRRELPMLDGFYRARHSAGLRVFAVATATEGSLPNYQLHHLFDALALSSVRSLHGPYGMSANGLPTNFVIDRAGRIRYAAAGAFDLDMLNTIIIPLLNEPAPAN